MFWAVQLWSIVILDSLARIFGSTDFNVDIEIYSMSWLLLYKYEGDSKLPGFFRVSQPDAEMDLLRYVLRYD